MGGKNQKHKCIMCDSEADKPVKVCKKCNGKKEAEKYTGCEDENGLPVACSLHEGTCPICGGLV